MCLDESAAFGVYIESSSQLLAFSCQLVASNGSGRPIRILKMGIQTGQPEGGAAS
jgi:hypothetical protein